MSELRVILAEKPSMGQTIAAALGLKTRGKGYIEGTDPNGVPTVCTWGIGHLVETVEPKKYDPTWSSWSWSVLPMVPSAWKYEVVSKTRDQFDVVKAQLARATELVVATDAGREGELIASLILKKAPCKAKKTLRLWTKSLTDVAIQDAYKVMKPWSATQGLQDAAHGRQRADWLVGMTGSRAMTLRARHTLGPNAGTSAWPIGRVLTPTLAILVDRELEIRNFKAKDFYVVEATFTHDAGTYKGRWLRGDQKSFEKEADARALVSSLQGKPAKVSKFETKQVRKGPEQLYDLTSLQREANRRFGFSAEKTLGIAQSLYDAKVLSYPRTGSRYLTHDDARKIPAWLKTLSKLEAYAGFVAEIKETKLGGRFINDAEVEDHTALVPTEEAPNWGTLSEDERRIYDMVARRFLAAFFPDRIEAKTVLLTDILGEHGPESFKTTGTAVLDPGWSRVDAPAASKAKKKAKATDEEPEEEPLNLSGAPVQVGDPAAVKSLGSAARETKPPKRMTEADLLAAMESAGRDLDEEELRAALKEVSGIGTPATRASIIEKLVDKGSSAKPKQPLVGREKNFLVPSEKGIELIGMLPFRDLRSAELTGRWETRLDQIAKGKGTLEAFMAEIEAYTHEMTKTLKEGVAEGPSRGPEAPRSSGGALEAPCPRCAARVDLKVWEGRWYTRCSTKACYFGFDCNEKGEATGKCRHCGTGRTKTTPNGSKVCADCNRWENEKPAAGEAGIKREATSAPVALGECPKCHKGTLKLRSGENGPFVSCSARPACDLSFSADEEGNALGGSCAKCKGPVHKFTSGKRKCACCGEWVNDGPRPSSGAKSPAKGRKPAAAAANKPPKPKDAICPSCKNPTRTLFTKRGKWAHRCDTCSTWYETA